MSTQNQKHTVKVSEQAYQALNEVAEQRYGNEDAITWSGLIYELCREQGQADLSEKTDLVDN